MSGTYQDKFEPPLLASDKWTATLNGSVGIDVGTPENGLFPLGLDVLGESVLIDSDGKIPVPSNQPFSLEIGYKEVYIAPPVDVNIFLGWRSVKKGLGVPLWGVDVLLNISPVSVYTFMKRTIVNGISSVTPLILDPTGGSDGRFKIERNGTVYSLFYYDGGWIHLDDVDLGYMELGFVFFGAFTDIGLVVPEGFPWLLQP